MASYPKVRAGQWVKPRRRFYKMACCDCGLVHKMEFKLVPRGNGKAILLRAWRDNRATAAIRRHTRWPSKADD